MESEIYTVKYNNKKYEYYIDVIEHDNEYSLIAILKGSGGCYTPGEEIKHTPIRTYKFDTASN